MNNGQNGVQGYLASLGAQREIDVTHEAQLALPMMKPGFEKMPLGGQTLPPGFPAPFLFADGLNSVETLLTNIQGLLKVAVDNAPTIQKRLKKEKKAKRKLQEALEFESKRREQVEQALKTATSPENLCMSLNEAVIPEVEPEHNGSQQENSAGKQSGQLSALHQGLFEDSHPSE
ncbi:unnamed protein product [Coregonus sp. 'balchen']|nr:unnamed protein product [Coregonus sp. 'balchen']